MKTSLKSFISRFYAGLKKHLLRCESPENHFSISFVLHINKDCIYDCTRHRECAKNNIVQVFRKLVIYFNDDLNYKRVLNKLSHFYVLKRTVFYQILNV